MSQRGSGTRQLVRRWVAPPLVAALVLTVLVACNSSNETTATTVADGPATTEDPVAAAEARVQAAQDGLAKAQDDLKSAGTAFCSEAESYITAIDRYGKLFTDGAATVGDVKTAGADLAAPKESVSSAAEAVTKAQSDVAAAAQELADAQAALAEASATASSVPVSSTTPVQTTPTSLVPPATINRVQQAEADLAKASEGITDATPLAQATAEYNSAAFALELAWLKLVSEAGCLSDERQAQAVEQVTAYTVALQTQLQQAGYYNGQIDGIYGPQTVDAVKQLQSDNDLPQTGYVDRATASALDKKLAGLNQQATEAAMTQTAALQTVLKLTGYWPGPIDGRWTDELTAALKQFQTALGVPPSGTVDTATIAAFQAALAEAKAEPTTTTAPPTTSPPTTRPPRATVTIAAPPTAATTAPSITAAPSTTAA
jgi:peptidoglycan hydrolase-like protein with peptidoglycan-binding domain